MFETPTTPAPRETAAAAGPELNRPRSCYVCKDPFTRLHPFYDSMLVKVTASGRRFVDAIKRMRRCLMEFRVRGVKTNIPFLIKLMDHEMFNDGECTTRFIDETPQLFQFPRRRDRATRLLTFLADIIVNGNTLVKDRPVAGRREAALLPDFEPIVELPKRTWVVHSSHRMRTIFAHHYILYQLERNGYPT